MIEEHCLETTLAVDSATGPPTEVRIFAAGMIETTKGVFIFDEQAATALVMKASDWGNEFSFDYEHNAVDPTISGPKPAAGWYSLAMKGGELWAINIRWTPKATDLIKNREYRYISPAFNADKDGRITSLINVALTNIPATKGMMPIITSADSDNAITLKIIPFKAFPVLNSTSWNESAAISRVKKWAKKADGTTDWDKYALAFACHDGRSATQFDSYRLCHHDVVDGNLVTSKAGVIACVQHINSVGTAHRAEAMEHLSQHHTQMGLTDPFTKKVTMAQKKMDDSTSEETKLDDGDDSDATTTRAKKAKKLANVDPGNSVQVKKLGDDDDDDGETDADDADDDDAQATKKTTGKMPGFIKKKIDDSKATKKSAAKTLDDGDDGDDQVAVKKSKKLSVMLSAIAGSEDEETQMGALVALAQSTETIKTLSAQVAELKADKENAAKADLIASATRAGKLAPAMHEWASEQSLKTLKSFVAMAPAVHAPAHKQASSEEAATAAVKTLSKDEREVMKTILGDAFKSPEEVEKTYLETKTIHLSRGSDQESE